MADDSTTSADNTGNHDTTQNPNQPYYGPTPGMSYNNMYGSALFSSGWGGYGSYYPSSTFNSSWGSGIGDPNKLAEATNTVNGGDGMHVADHNAQLFQQNSNFVQQQTWENGSFAMAGLGAAGLLGGAALGALSGGSKKARVGKAGIFGLIGAGLGVFGASLFNK